VLDAGGVDISCYRLLQLCYRLLPGCVTGYRGSVGNPMTPCTSAVCCVVFLSDDGVWCSCSHAGPATAFIKVLSAGGEACASDKTATKDKLFAAAADCWRCHFCCSLQPVDLCLHGAACTACTSLCRPLCCSLKCVVLEPVLHTHSHRRPCVNLCSPWTSSARRAYSPASHTIIEAHPDVYAHMCKLGWEQKPGVKILFGRWQDVVQQLETYDATLSTRMGSTMKSCGSSSCCFPRSCGRGACYSYFNGLASDNFFFHMVYGRWDDWAVLPLDDSDFDNNSVTQAGAAGFPDGSGCLQMLYLYRILYTFCCVHQPGLLDLRSLHMACQCCGS